MSATEMPDAYDFAEAPIRQHLDQEEVVVNGVEWCLNDTADPTEMTMYDADDETRRYLVRVSVEFTEVTS